MSNDKGTKRSDRFKLIKNKLKQIVYQVENMDIPSRRQRNYRLVANKHILIHFHPHSHEHLQRKWWNLKPARASNKS